MSSYLNAFDFGFLIDVAALLVDEASIARNKLLPLFRRALWVAAFSGSFALPDRNARALSPILLILSSLYRNFVCFALAAELTLLKKRALVLLLFLRSIWPELLPLGYPTFSLLGGHQIDVDFLDSLLPRMTFALWLRICLLIGRTPKLVCFKPFAPVAPIALYFYFPWLLCVRSGALLLASHCPDASPDSSFYFLNFSEILKLSVCSPPLRFPLI